MHKDLEEIMKIVKWQKKKCSREEAIFVLGKICCRTKEPLRHEKHKEYQERKNELAGIFQEMLGDIVTNCMLGKCEQCILSKWCNTYRKIKQKDEQRRNGLSYADFFCGAGGLSLGFHTAGYKMSLANDIQECCIDTISLNHPEVPEKHLIAGDINDVLERIKDLSRYERVDVVIGGPPCQGFSMANRQRIIDDPRNHLYKSFVKAIKILSPYFFVMENVRGMLGVKEQIIQDFDNIGYIATAHILNAKEFGIPQNRERVIFIGNRIGVDNEEVFKKVFAEGSLMPHTVLIDAIGDLPVLSAKKFPNHYFVICF